MYRNILVPVDLDEPESWTGALMVASSLAKCFPAKVTLCTVVSSAQAIERGEWLPISVEQLLFDAKARLEGVAASAAEEPSCDVEIAAGTIAGGVLEIAERMKADLILLVSHRPGPRDHLIAANAIRIARRASCSVLIARPNG
jgi:nucleotide-binding universal stress UspA family protein